MLNKKFKKAISSVTMFATVVCLSGVSMLAPLGVSAATTIVDGDIIKSNATNSDGTPTLGSLDVYIVKMVGTKKFKRLVLNPQVFASYGHLKWSNIKTVSQAEEDSFTTSTLVRVDGDSKVYALTPAGDTGAKSWVNVSADQFMSAGSDSDSIYTINSVDAGNYSTHTDITTVTQLKAFYADGTLPGGEVSGDLTVSLSAATPEAINIPVGSSADFTAIKLAAGSSSATINSITITASGYGTATNLDNVALYIDGAKVGSSKDINSEKEATFNFSDPINVPANGSKILTIKASAAAAGTYKLGIKEAADIITAGGTVGGSFPIYGNGMAADANVATGDVTMANIETADTNNAFGEDNVLLAAFDLTANHEGAIVQSFRLKNGGTNEDGIVDNIKLFIDGDEITDGTYDAATGYVTIAVNGEYKIKKGETASVEIYGDLGIASANDTIKLYLKSKDDLVFTGEDYGFGIQIDGAIPAAIDAAGDAITVTLITGDVTIDMDKAATPAADVKADTDNVVLATFTVVSNNEDAVLEQIVDNAGDDFEIDGTDIEAGDIENVEMRDVDTGVLYDIAATRVSDTQWTLSMTDEISLVKGEKKTFEIRADLNSTIDANATLYVVIDKQAMKITGAESDASITDISPATITSATATVKIASLTWTTTALTAKTVVPSATDVVLYAATLEAGTVDDVKLSSVKLTTNAAVADDFTDSNISTLYLYLNGVKIKTLDGDIVEGTAGTNGTINFTSLLTTDGANVIKKGETVNLEVKADFAATLTSTASFSLEINDAAADIVVKDATSGTAFAETVSNVGTGSRTVQVAVKGTMKVELLTTNTKADNDTLMLAGATTVADKYLGELKFTTTNEKIKLTDLALIGDGTFTSSDVAEVYLVDSTGVVKATKIPSATGDTVFSNLAIEFPADATTSLFLAVKAKGMNVDGDVASTATQGRTVQFHINPAAGSIKAKGVDSNQDIALAVDTDANVEAGQWSAAGIVSKTATISGSVITSVTSAALDSSVLTGGTGKTIGKYTLTFDNGSNRTTGNEELKAVLDALVVTVSKSSAVELSNVKVQIDGTSNKVTAVAANLGAASNSGTATWGAGTLSNATTGLADGGKVDGTVTLTITADVVTTAAVDEYAQTSIAAVNTDLDYTVGGVAVANNLLPYDAVTGTTLSE